jgi:hypothetical protein
MTFCEHCGEKIDFLPFKCKYCGGSYCNEHRLPEYHECTFELAHVQEASSDKKEPKLKVKLSKKGVVNVKKYIKRQEKQKKKTIRLYRDYSTKKTEFQGIKIILLLIVIFSITAVIFRAYGIDEYISLSLNGVVLKFTYHTFITSLFIYPIDPFDTLFFFSIIFIALMFYFAYIMGKLIERMFGQKFLFKLFLFSGFISILFYLLLRLALIAIIPIVNIFWIDAVGLAWGGIFGLFTFTIFPAMNQKLTSYLALIPVRMSGKSFLFIIILFRLIPGVFYGLAASPIYFLLYLPELGGIFGSYLVYKYNLFRD